MALYSAYEILGKTLLLNKTVNYYKVIDLNELGDKAKPAGTLKAGSTIVADSYLSATPAYVSSYGIHYAQRSDPYFTFYLGGVYCAVVIGSGFFSIQALKDQGAITVKEELAQAAAEEEAATNPLGLKDAFKGLGGLFKNIVPILIIVAIIIVLIVLAPTIKNLTSKK
jgi:hypothetical protein